MIKIYLCIGDDKHRKAKGDDHIKINNLEVGQVVKNYRELCSLLEIPVLNGKSKRLQVEDFLRYFTYRKQGNKFIIESIYETPLVKFNNKGLYSNIMQLIVTDYLLNSNKSTVIITANKLLLHMYMYNDNYAFCSQYVPQLSRYTKINEKTIYDFYNTSGGSFRKSLESALNSLRSKALLIYEKLIYVCTNENEHRRAKEHERTFIINAETEVLKELGYKEIEHVRVSPQWFLFKSKIVKRLKEINLKYHYICYSLTVNRKHIEESHNVLLQFTLDEIERNDLKLDLNNKVMNRLIENAHTRKENAFLSGRKAKMRNSNTYIDDMTKLIHILIDVNANDIEGEIKRLLKQEKRQNEILSGLDDLFS